MVKHSNRQKDTATVNATSLTKRILSGLLATVIVATSGGAFFNSVNVEAATDTLSNEERGVIFANSRTDFRDESIYFVITTRFYDGDTSNNARTSEDDNKAKNPADDPSWRGDFKGLIEKLDYIKALGFTAIWITPVVENDSGYDYHGYHAYDFSEVDSRYESSDVTYQDLIDAVHAKGMKLIQDVVLNHTCNWGEENLLQLTSEVYSERNQAVMNGSNDPENIYHHNGFCGGGDWDNYEAQRKTIADDCFDLETENPKVYNYLVDCYTNYINMGVDAFRVDTVKHLSRLTLNTVFVPAFKEAGGEDFYMFGEVCTKGHNVWYRDAPPISTCFYTWADDESWTSRWSTDLASNEALVEEHYSSHMDTSSQPTSNNAFLNGNEYHTPDYSESSGMNVIDFQMHWSFYNANNAFATALGEDQYFNDSTWNVVYVDSHDYAPDECQTQRYTGGTEAWAENLSLMFTFRGIPCIYYGSEVEFQAGMPIDVGPNTQLANTGRAYFGDYLEGTVTATDFTVFGNVSGAVAETLQAPLSQHLMRLNRIRQAIPALRKGQYSTEGCSGNIAFKRRYTDSTTDSFVCVAISGNATFSGIPNGKYVDAVTGDVQNVTNGTLSASVSGKGNMKVYVLDTAKTPAPGRVIPNGQFLTDGGAVESIGPVEIDIVNPTGITLSNTSVTVKEGMTEKVTATITPSNATNKTVTWTSSNTSVATVSGGTISGVAKGTATITAKTSNGLTATVNVTVTENADIVKPTGITLNSTSLTLTEGDSDTLTATITPSNATNKTVTWTSSDTSVATVSGGTVTAVSEGTATITASTFNGFKATATVTVEAKQVTKIVGVYFEKPSSWSSNINVYLFSNNQTVGASWPGTAMKDMGDGVYGLEYTTTDSNLMLIFNDGSNQTADLEYVQNGYYNSSGFVKTIDPTETGKVNVKYVDTDGNVLGSQTLTGDVGSSYTTSAKTFTGYTLQGTPSNASGTYTASTITVTYTYKKDQTIVSLTNSSTISATTITKGNAVTLTGSASGGTSPYQYTMLAKHSSASSWTTLKSYDSTTTKSWTPANSGTYTVAIKVKDSAGTVVEKLFTLTVNANTTTLTNNSTISATTITKGTEITMTGKASGGTSPYQYAMLAKHSSASSWTVLKGYNTTATKKWTPANTGTYKVAIKVKDSTGKIVEKLFTLTVNAAALTNSSTISATTITKGTAITMTGKASGGTAPYQYSMVVKHSSASSWTVLKGYNTTATNKWTPANTGTYKVAIKVKDSAGKIVEKLFTLTVNAAALTNSSTISATTITKGTAITMTGKASGGTAPYQYSMVVKHSSASSWTVLKGYNTTATNKWTPANTGTYKVAIKVKDSAGKIVEKLFTLTVNAAALTNSSTISATSISQGTEITMTGKASGGTAPYQYSMVVKHSSASSWTVLKSYNTTATKKWTPANTGTYKVAIKVKDSTGKVVEKLFTLTVNAAALTNKSSLGSTSVSLGSAVSLKGSAIGGTSPYTYKYEYLKIGSSAWKTVKDYSSSTSTSFTPASSGTYSVRITVKDSTGTTSASYLSLTVI